MTLNDEIDRVIYEVGPDGIITAVAEVCALRAAQFSKSAQARKDVAESWQAYADDLRIVVRKEEPKS